MTTSPVLTGAFWIGMLDRAVKSFAQVLLVMWGADEGMSLLDIDFGNSLGVAGLAFVLSVLTSFVSAPMGDRGSTSFLPGGK